MKNIRSQIVGFNPEKRTESETIALGQRAASFINSRLYKLEKAGLSTKLTTSGLKHVSKISNMTPAMARRNIKNARRLIQNPLSTPGKIHKAEKISGRAFKGSRKVIDPLTGKAKFVSRNSPKDDYIEYSPENFRTFEAFKEWAAKHHPELSSEELWEIWFETSESRKDPITYYQKENLSDFLQSEWGLIDDDLVDKLYGEYVNDDEEDIDAKLYWIQKRDELEKRLEKEGYIQKDDEKYSPGGAIYR